MRFVRDDGPCPNCGGGLVRATKLGLLATTLGSGAFAMTLMACYGCPDCTYDDYREGDANADARTRDASKITCTGDSRYACYQCCVGAYPGELDEQDQCATACEPKEDSGADGPKDSGSDAQNDGASDAGTDADADAK